MQRYYTSVPRAAFAVAALGMTALTFTASVVVPAIADGPPQEATSVVVISTVTPLASSALATPVDEDRAMEEEEPNVCARPVDVARREFMLQD